MANRVYKNCIITRGDSEVLKEYDITSTTSRHTGIDLKATTVYSPCCGVVIHVCLVENSQAVVIQYSENISLRFTHLADVTVVQNQTVQPGDVIGKADNYVHFEYLTVEENDPLSKVYVLPTLALYKHDPCLVLDGNIQFDHSLIYLDGTQVVGETYDELSNHRGL